jgi:hypothetical protein
MPDTSSRLSLGEVLRQSGSLFARKGLTFLALGAFPTVFFCALGYSIVFGLGPGGTLDPVIIWENMSWLRRLGFLAADLTTLALVFRTCAAAIRVTAEWNHGREMGAIVAYLRVPRKSVRIPWLCFLFSLLTGPLFMLAGFILGLAAFPGFLAAVLEGSGARDSLRRGWKVLKQRDGLVFAVYGLYLGGIIVLSFACALGATLLPALPAAAMPVASALFLTLLLLASEWFVGVLTLAYLGPKGPAAAAHYGERVAHL